MAELIDFYIYDRTTLIHRIDPRVKIVALTGLSIAIFYAELLGMVIGTVAILTVIMPMSKGIIRLFSRLWGFLIILTGVLIANSFSIPGETILTIWKISFSLEGVQAGLLFFWRILLIIVVGYVISASTSATNIRNAVNWIFQFVPFVPHKALSDMMRLLVRFLPMILIRSHLIGEAQKSRGIQYRKNPIYRLRVFSLSLLRQSFLSADQLNMAMASRCYHSRRPRCPWPIHKFDIYCLFSIGLLIAVFLIF